MATGDTPAPCLEQGCYRLAGKRGRCPQHELPAFNGNYRKERLPKDWPLRRRLVFQRDGDICYVCGAPGSDRIDHVNPGDDHSLENLKPIHDLVAPHCHMYKTSAEGNASKIKPLPKRVRAEDLPF